MRDSTNLLTQCYISAIKELVDALKKYGMREHYLEDADCNVWREDQSKCDCGADEHNAAVQAIIDKYEVKE